MYQYYDYGFRGMVVNQTSYDEKIKTDVKIIDLPTANEKQKNISSKIDYRGFSDACVLQKDHARKVQERRDEIVSTQFLVVTTEFEITCILKAMTYSKLYVPKQKQTFFSCNLLLDDSPSSIRLRRHLSRLLRGCRAENI